MRIALIKNCGKNDAEGYSHEDPGDGEVGASRFVSVRYELVADDIEHGSGGEGQGEAENCRGDPPD